MTVARWITSPAACSAQVAGYEISFERRPVADHSFGLSSPERAVSSAPGSSHVHSLVRPAVRPSVRPQEGSNSSNSSSSSSSGSSSGSGSGGGGNCSGGGVGGSGQLEATKFSRILRILNLDLLNLVLL
eukprot:SAG22_NODE_830_length_6941_cov_2.114294_3_plen_129_part_00